MSATESCEEDKVYGEEVFDNVLGQRVKIRIKDLLVCSKPLWDLMFKGTIGNDKSKENKEVAQAVSICSLTLSEWAYAASTPKVKVKLGGIIA